MTFPSADLLARVAQVLTSHHVDDFAFTGGVAVGVWAEPRQTRDLDVCGTLPLDEDMVRFRVGDWDVDLFVAKDDYDRACLARATSMALDGIEVRVVSAEDLLIHKMIKLRSDRRRLLQDIADVRAVISARGAALDWDHVRTWLPPSEAQLLSTVAETPDDELVKRLLGL